MNLYFDNAAAEECSPETLERFSKLTLALPGNQESTVSGTRSAVEDAEKRILHSVCRNVATEYSVLFLHTGTDAVNAAFAAATETHRLKKVILSGGEHACMKAAVKRFFTDCPIRELTCGPDGIFHEENCFQENESVLTAVHFVQSETGAVQPLAKIHHGLEHSGSGSLFLVDAVQGIGKVHFDFAAVQPDFLTISGQKIGVPSGAALIYRRHFAPFFRSYRLEQHQIGRLPPALAVLLSEVLEKRLTALNENYDRALTLKNLFFSLLEKKLYGQYRRTLPDTAPASPFIAHILLGNGKIFYQGAIIARALSRYGITAAPGSACDAETDHPSETLRWMRIPKEWLYSALRISFSPLNDAAGVEKLVDSLAEIVATY